MTKPVVVGNSTLYLSDCREILSTLPIGGAVITDPPYGIGFKYEGRADDGADLDDALRLIKRRGFPLGLLMYPEEMMAQVVPVMGAPNECLAWCYPSNLKRQFRLWGLWGLSADFAAVKQPARNSLDPRVLAEVSSYDWWEQPQVKNVSFEKESHPCQLPVSMLERIIKLSGPDFVVDPFMGSGTTGVACMNLGRKFLGIEIEPKYFEIACRRIEDAQRQSRMFA